MPNSDLVGQSNRYLRSGVSWCSPKNACSVSRTPSYLLIVLSYTVVFIFLNTPPETWVHLCYYYNYSRLLFLPDYITKNIKES